MARLNYLQSVFKNILVTLFCLLILVSCVDDGSDGKDGANGIDGIDGTDGVNAISPPSAFPDKLSTTFTSTTIDGGVVTVEFLVTNGKGENFIGLSANILTFTMAKLYPEDYLALGEPSSWQNYSSKLALPEADELAAVIGPEHDSTPTETLNPSEPEAPIDPDDPNARPKALGESIAAGNFGTFIDNNNGTYTYTFSTNVTTVTEPIEVEYISEHIHRVGVIVFDKGTEFPVVNASYTWRPSDGATDGIDTRDIVDEATCNNCHGELAQHSGDKRSTKLCVTCHNPGSIDPTSLNTLDIKVMFHKLHRGKNLPTVAAGGEYVIWGHGKRDYSGVAFPQDIRNCSNCHNEDNAEVPHALAPGVPDDGSPLPPFTPDAANWYMKPSIAACGSCHDNIDFTIAGTEPNGHPGGPQADNQLCSQCHGPNGGFPVQGMHEGIIDNQQLAVDKLVFTIDSAIVENDKSLTVGISIMLDGLPVNYDDIKTYIAGGTDSGALMVNYDDGTGYQFSYSSPQGGFTPETNLIKLKDCTPSGNNDGKHTCLRSADNSIGSDGTIALTLVQIPLCVNEHASNGILVDCASPDNTAEIALNPPRKFFNLDGSEAADYVEKIAADKGSCENCHGNLDIHNVFKNDFDSHAATDFNQCTSCHNATKSAFYLGRPGDLKSHVHSFHSKADSVNADKNLAENYPDDISNCNSCHSAGQFDLPLKVNTRASKAQITATGTEAGAITFTSATAVVCSSCHIKVPVGYIDPSAPGFINTNAPSTVILTSEDQALVTHMVTNGAVFGSTDFDTANIVEACAVCHGPGKSVALEKVHNLR